MTKFQEIAYFKICRRRYFWHFSKIHFFYVYLRCAWIQCFWKLCLFDAIHTWQKLCPSFEKQTPQNFWTRRFERHLQNSSILHTSKSAGEDVFDFLRSSEVIWWIIISRVFNFLGLFWRNFDPNGPFWALFGSMLAPFGIPWTRLASPLVTCLIIYRFCL